MSIYTLFRGLNLKKKKERKKSPAALWRLELREYERSMKKAQFEEVVMETAVRSSASNYI